MKTRHVSWRLPYSIMIVSTALLFAQENLAVSVGWHKLIEVAIVVGMFALLARWLARNEAALEEEDLRRTVVMDAAERGQRHLTAVQLDYLAAEERRRLADQPYGRTPAERR